MCFSVASHAFIIPPLPRVLSTLNTIEDVLWYAVHDEVLDRLVVIFPSHGGLDAINIVVIEVRLSY